MQFKDIKDGEQFEYEGELFIRVSNNPAFNAVNISNPLDIVIFLDNARVKAVGYIYAM